MNYYKKCAIFSIAVFFSFSAYSNDMHIRISESDIDAKLPTTINIPNKDPEGSVTYIESNKRYKTNLKYPQDVDKVANSSEFEIYKINENSLMYTVFESSTGICYGLKSPKLGVNVTDLTNIYLVPGDSEQYYGNITGFTVYEKNAAKNIQYVPVYIIRDPVLAKQILEESEKNRKQIVLKNIEKNQNILLNVVCQKK